MQDKTIFQCFRGRMLWYKPEDGGQPNYPENLDYLRLVNTNWAIHWYHFFLDDSHWHQPAIQQVVAERWMVLLQLLLPNCRVQQLELDSTAFCHCCPFTSSRWCVLAYLTLGRRLSPLWLPYVQTPEFYRYSWIASLVLDGAHISSSQGKVLPVLGREGAQPSAVRYDV